MTNPSYQFDATPNLVERYPPPTRSVSTATSVLLGISNMHCPTCVSTITTLLFSIPNVRNVNVNLVYSVVTFDVLGGVSADEVTILAKRVLHEDAGFEFDNEGVTVSSTSNSWVQAPTQGDRGKDARSRHAKHRAYCQSCRHVTGHADRSVPIPKSPNGQFEDATIVSTFSIEGMTCASCATAITKGVKDMNGVNDVQIDLLANAGTVSHSESLAALSIAQCISDIGYDATLIRSDVASRRKSGNPEPVVLTTTFAIEGMTCSSCSSAIKHSLSRYDAIKDMTIDVLGNSGIIKHLASLPAETIKGAIEDAGYQVVSLTTSIVSPSDNDLRVLSPDEVARRISVVIHGIYCESCVDKLNVFLAQLPLESFTPFTRSTTEASISYFPNRPLTVRDILDGLANVSPGFKAELRQEQSMQERSQKIQRREFVKLGLHVLLAVVFAIPAFIIGIVAMVILPRQHPFAMYWMRPVWGRATLGTVVLWPLATVVQFGVGSIFYRRSFGPLAIRMKRLFLISSPRLKVKHDRPRSLSWHDLISFGSMDLLVVLSTTTAYLASISMLILDVQSTTEGKPTKTQFDAPIFLIMFILIGRFLEAYAKSRTTDAVSLLGQLRPDTALLFTHPPYSQQVQVSSEVTQLADGVNDRNRASIPLASPLSRVDKGDLILIPAGAIPPTDGIVISGETTIDESSLTGESVPVRKTVGDEVLTGTTNLSSPVIVRVTRLGGDTTLQRIIAAVSNASSSKAPIERLAERLTGRFVPMVVYFAIIVFGVWLSVVLTGTINPEVGDVPGGNIFWAMEFGIAVLVVACPCGIGLAVPCATAVGNGLVAAVGILAAGGGEAFLGATMVTTAVLDKTGTLTQGKPVVVNEYWRPMSPENEVRSQRAIQMVETASTHPLAQGVVRHLEDGLDPSSDHNGIHVTRIDEIVGHGLSASVGFSDNVHIMMMLGDLRLMKDSQVTIASVETQMIEDWTNQAKSVVLVATRLSSESALELLAMFALVDPPREETVAALDSIRRLGIKVVMLTGDNRRTAEAVGRAVGIMPDDVRAEVGPEGKADVIRELQGETVEINHPWWKPLASPTRKATVLFAGDGLNDSVALAAADVSVAMGHGSQVALASADFVLLASNLASIPTLLRISTRVTRRQRLNLVWACLFNFVAIPFASGIFYGAGGIRIVPVWAAVLMAASSLSVILSSLALRWGL